jgi:hypothetical protein
MKFIFGSNALKPNLCAWKLGVDGGLRSHDGGWGKLVSN